MGTPEFAVSTLEKLVADGHHVGAVITQPDRPQGRFRRITPPPIKLAALRLGLPVFQPERPDEPTVLERLRIMDPELGVVVAYGHYMPGSVRRLPARGWINLHASLLPRYRGAAPVAWAIMNGERTTGVTVLEVGRRMDAGDILAQERVEIGADETAGQLEARLAVIGADLLARVLRQVESGTARPVKQREPEASSAPRLSKADGIIDWSWAADRISDFVRAVTPWPSAQTVLVQGERRRRVIILAGRAFRDAEPLPSAIPGSVCEVSASGIEVATGRNTYLILRLQAEGKRPLDAPEFARGYRVVQGDRFVSDK